MTLTKKQIEQKYRCKIKSETLDGFRLYSAYAEDEEHRMFEGCPVGYNLQEVLDNIEMNLIDFGDEPLFIRVRDNEGVWKITHNDCCLVCSECKHGQKVVFQAGVYRKDKCTVCGAPTIFHYWTDREDIEYE